ncbi:MAG: class I SAM-dependent methyltransferase [Promethearchaeia archaeon]
MNKKDARTEKKREIIKKYNSSAEIYDQRYKDIQFRKFKLSLGKIDIHKKFLGDIGCGTGLFFDFLRDFTSFLQDSDFHYIGIDISWEMLQMFKKKLEMRVNNDKSKTIPFSHHLVLSDAEHLPFRANTFDAIFSFTVLQNLSNRALFFRELLEIIKNEGDLILSTLKKKKKNFDVFYSICNSRVEFNQQEQIGDAEDIIYISKRVKKI